MALDDAAACAPAERSMLPAWTLLLIRAPVRLCFGGIGAGPFALSPLLECNEGATGPCRILSLQWACQWGGWADVRVHCSGSWGQCQGLSPAGIVARGPPPGKVAQRREARAVGESGPVSLAVHGSCVLGPDDWTARPQSSWRDGGPRGWRVHSRGQSTALGRIQYAAFGRQSQGAVDDKTCAQAQKRREPERDGLDGVESGNRRLCRPQEVNECVEYVVEGDTGGGVS